MARQDDGRQAQVDEMKQAAKDFAVDDLLGRRDWKKSKVGYVLGVGAFRDTVESVKEQGSGSLGRIRSLWKHAISPESRGIGVTAEISDPHERFREAMRLNGRTLADVNRSIDVTYKQTYLFGGLTIFSLVLGFFMLGVMLLRGHVNLLGACFAFLPLPLVGALALRAGWTNWAFSRRRLEGVGAYLRSGAILPRKAPKMPKAVASRPAKGNLVRGVVVATGIGLLSLLGHMQEARADTSTGTSTTCSSTTAGSDPSQLAQQVVGSPCSGDLFLKMMTVVIPNVGPVPDSEFGKNPVADATKSALGIFAGVLLFLGVAINGYQILTGLVASAKEGKALGDRYHEVWAPLRVVVGYGFLTPLLGGLCAAQVLVLYLIVWGGNMANIVWGTYASELVNLYETNASGSSASDQRKTEQGKVANAEATAVAMTVVRDLAQKSLCLAAIRENEKQVSHGSNDVSKGPSLLNNGNHYWVSFSANNGVVPVDDNPMAVLQSTDDCGTFVMDVTGADPTSTTATAKNAIDMAAVGAVKQSLPLIYTDMDTDAQTYILTGSSNPPAFGPGGNAKTDTLSQAIAGYAQAIYGAAQKQFDASDPTNTSASDAKNAIDSVKATLQTEGWAASGTFYLTLSRLSSAMYGSFTAAVSGSANPQDQTTIVDPTAEALLKGKGMRVGMLPAFQKWFSSTIGTMQISGTDSSSKDSLTTAVSAFGSSTPTFEFWNTWMMKIVGGFDNLLDTSPFMAMQRLTDFGNQMISTAIAAYAISSAGSGIGTLLATKGAGAAGGAGEIVGFFTGVGHLAAAAIGGIVSGIMTIANYMIFGLLAAGIMHAYVLPMIPYIMVAFFVMGMLILVVEGLVAAPLWAFFHIRMDGQEFVDQVQKPGYMIAFNLLLRPTLMVFGLILSNSVFGCMVFFTSHTFMPMVSALNKSNSIGAIGVVVMIVIMTYIHFQLALRSFKLITEVPDRVTRWFGQGGENLGEDKHASDMMGFAIQHTSRGAEQALGAAGGRNAMRGGGGGTQKGLETDKPKGGRSPDANKPDASVTDAAEAGASPGRQPAAPKESGI